MTQGCHCHDKCRRALGRGVHLVKGEIEALVGQGDSDGAQVDFAIALLKLEEGVGGEVDRSRPACAGGRRSFIHSLSLLGRESNKMQQASGMKDTAG